MPAMPNLTPELLDMLYTLPHPKGYLFHTFFISHYPGDIPRYGAIYSSSNTPEFLLLNEISPAMPDFSGLKQEKAGGLDAYEGYASKFPLIEFTWPGIPKSTLTYTAKNRIITLAGISGKEGAIRFLEQLQAAPEAGQPDELKDLFAGFTLLPKDLNGISPVTAFFTYLGHIDDLGKVHRISSARLNFLIGKDLISLELRRGCEHEECLPGLLPAFSGSKTLLSRAPEIIQAGSDTGACIYHYSPGNRISIVCTCQVHPSPDLSSVMRQLLELAIAALNPPSP